MTSVYPHGVYSRHPNPLNTLSNEDLLLFQFSLISLIKIRTVYYMIRSKAQKKASNSKILHLQHTIQYFNETTNQTLIYPFTLHVHRSGQSTATNFKKGPWFSEGILNSYALHISGWTLTLKIDGAKTSNRCVCFVNSTHHPQLCTGWEKQEKERKNRNN